MRFRVALFERGIAASAGSGIAGGGLVSTAFCASPVEMDALAVDHASDWWHFTKVVALPTHSSFYYAVRF